MRLLFSLILVTMASPTLHAQAASSPCSSAPFRQFDFWVGNWRVADQDGTFAGRNSISVEQNGCVVVERWQSAKGGTGMSMNHFDPVTGQWHQHWAGLGLILDMTGALQRKAMVLEGPLHYVTEKRTTLLRGTWTALPDGRVRQHFVESSDNGKTWSNWFDGYYTRIDASAAPSE